MSDRVGQQLGNYRLLQLIGRGGFAEVYEGKHVHLDTLAAVKVLHTQLSREDIEKFQHEARTIAHLTHAHIVRVLDYGVEGSTPFLVMDYAPNGTLRQRHPRGTILPLPTIISYITQIAAALQYAHDQRVIHRDVKPENMLLGRQQEVLLSDFGIALAAQSSRYRSVHEMAGTIHYMAPEQIKSQPQPASDQYALGIIAYEWLSGDHPFHGSFFELASQHIMAPPPPLYGKAAEASLAIEEVVLTALAKDPEQRFASVQTFAKALERAYHSDQRHQFALLDAPAPAHQSLPAAVAIAPANQSLPAAVAIAPAHTPQLPKRDTLRRVALVGHADYASLPSQPSIATPSSEQAPLEAQIIAAHDTPQPTLQPSKRRISRRAALVGLTGLVAVSGGIAWLVLSQKLPLSLPFLNSPAESTVEPTPKVHYAPGALVFTYQAHADIVHAVSWSFDGQRVASGSFDTTVQVWDATTGDNTLIYTGHANKVLTMAYAPDGSRIASGGVDATVQVWNATTGTTLFTYADHTNTVRALAWSTRPSGKYIASASSDSTVRVWNAATRTTAYVYKGHTAAVNAVSWSIDGNRIASGSDDTTVQVWDSIAGTNAFTYHGHTKEVRTIQWSPDGTFIASGGHDKTIQVWNAATGNKVNTYQGHTDFVNAIVWSPDGKYIASASSDATVQVWDAFTGDKIRTYSADAGVLTVDWGPDSTRIVSGGDANTAQVWQAG